MMLDFNVLLFLFFSTVCPTVPIRTLSLSAKTQLINSVSISVFCAFFSFRIRMSIRNKNILYKFTCMHLSLTGEFFLYRFLSSFSLSLTLFPFAFDIS